ncbi:PIR Superfamily Protein [Plasmodium ovale curtisi]|uniref:PIR Superfamily Protein n=1 Tax=Plasmodium ovale curtisi TaxID=864141 RepID=A0A1A8WL60_PLAOA|nr:PIR Superfamily Protein [Plasmodium ovale curtisi]
MSNKRKEFTLTELAEKYTFFEESDLYKFYQEVDKTYKGVENNNFCNKVLLSGVEDPVIITFLKSILRGLYPLLNNENFPIVNNINSQDKHCIYLKYWLYDQLIINNFHGYDIKIIFDFLEKHKNACIKAKSPEKSCVFYNLTLEDIDDIKNLYAYSELFYETKIKNFREISKDKKYLNYFKRGFDLYRRSKIKCLSARSKEFCKEFNDYKSIYEDYKKQSAFLSCQEHFLDTLYNEDTSSSEEALLKVGTPKETVDSDFYELLKKDDLLEKSHLSKFYESLNEGYGTHNDSSCTSLSEYSLKEKTTICELLGHVENILEKWDKIYTPHQELSSNKACDYMNYWFYDRLSHVDATMCDIEIFYFLWHKYARAKHPPKKTCYNKEYSGLSKKQLRNKKTLFDFLEYYDYIKDELNKDKNENQSDYCKYIKGIFQLYKDMERKNISHSYSEELKLFHMKFVPNDELHFLEEKCPDMCLEFVFNKKLKTLCPFEEKSLSEEQKEKLKACEHLKSSSDRGHIDEKYEKFYNITNLTTYNIYKELNEEAKTDNSYSICERLIPFNDIHCGIYDLCIKVVRNLKKLSRMENKKRTDRCEFITHWVYDEIRKIPNIFSNNSYGTDAIREFFNAVYDILRKLDITNCFFNTININFDEQKEKKYLHDYFKNYNKIKNEIVCNNTECEKYCEYVTSINELYGKYINRCCYCFKFHGCKERYPDYFKCDDIYNPHNIFEKLKCNQIEKFRKGMVKVGKSNFADDHVLWLTDKYGKEEKTLLKLEKIDSSSTPEKICSEITCDPFYVAAIGAFGLMGFFLLFFILYKLTPLGSYFHNRGTRKKRNHFQKRYKTFLDDDVEFKHGNMKNRRMSLAYHQVRRPIE